MRVFRGAVIYKIKYMLLRIILSFLLNNLKSIL